MRPRQRKYLLCVVPAPHGRYGVELRQAPPEGASPSAPDRLVGVHGVALEGIVDRVIHAVKATGARASALRADRTEPFVLDEETGVRLGLLMLAVHPLRKASRIMAMSQTTASMTTEEAYYWFSRCTDENVGRRARRALRVLLAEV